MTKLFAKQKDPNYSGYRENIYVACEEVNFVWRNVDVQRFDYLWANGTTDITALAAYFNRPIKELAYLIIDRAEKCYIMPSGGPGSKYIEPPESVLVKGVRTKREKQKTTSLRVTATRR